MSVIAIRTIIIYVVLIIAMRLMGKRQLGDLQPIELVVTLLISDLAVVPMQDPGTPLISGLLPILLLVALEIFLSGWMVKSAGFSRLIAGNPIPVIQNGKIQPNALKKLRLPLSDLTENLRSQGIFDLQEIETAIVETSGSISVYLRAPFQPSRRTDVAQKRIVPESTPMVLICDGEICQWALSVCGKSEEEITKVLRKQSLKPEDVFLMTTDANGHITVIPRGAPA